MTLTASGCERAPAPDQLARAEDRCYLKVKSENVFIGIPECFKQIPTEKIRGVWIIDLERSIFVENPVKNSHATVNPEDEIWLELNEDAQKATSSVPYGHYEIYFLGKRARTLGAFGHLGMYRRGVLLEKIISIKRVH